ncbi:hypothetical protein K883_02094 [Mycobacterium sp. TKK-01-0059]|nr:hypothetical protein K883_02094 [Mycobacterium sp. TKK-01-0059]
MAKTPRQTVGDQDGGAVPLHERPEFTAWLTASCQRQGLPVTITDPIVIDRIATLLGANSKARPAVHTRHTGRTRPMSRLREPGVPGAMTA